MKAAPSAAAKALADQWPLARSVAWQMLGSAATLAAALWVSWQMGLAAQGEFGLAKSWFDAGAALAALGLPQGLLHLQYRLQVPPAALRGGLSRHIAAMALACAAAAALLWMRGWPLAAWVAASLPFAVAHLLARSLLLRQSGAELFGLATALPALLVLSAVLALSALGRSSGFAGALWGAAAAASCISVTMAWPRGAAPVANAWPRRELWRVSLQSYVQQALAALTAAALLSAVAASRQGAIALGQAALGLQLYQVFVVLAGIASPLLFDRLARRQHPGLSDHARALQLGMVIVVGLLLAGAAVVLIATAPATRPSWLLPMCLMLPAGVAAVAARLAGTVLLARGDYRELSLQAAGRVLLALACLLVALPRLPAAAAVALALLVIEAATWWRCHHCLRREGAAA